MTISIVTVSYNQCRFLKQALRSVIDQGYPNLEYIVVDPGSNDGSRSVVEGQREHIDHVVFEPDSGPSEGLNSGFARASGEIFGFLNADDFLLPGSLQSVEAAFRRFPKADVIAAHGWLVDIHGDPIRKKHSNQFGAWRYLHRGAHLLQQSTFFRAEAFRKVGGFNVHNRTCWDGELWLDMALMGCQFQILHDYWSCFRVYDESLSGQVAQGKSSWRSYERDRNRMFRRATGRDPAGLVYGLRWGAAQLLKWGTHPLALFDRLRSLAPSRSKHASFQAWQQP
ncbi:MAG: glycosyltransferase family 2 protein [Geminicoccaceae bacterium]